MNQPSQPEVIAFLSDGANLPGQGPVEVVQTHGAVVFLSGADAYKIKRDVRYDYLSIFRPCKSAIPRFCASLN